MDVVRLLASVEAVRCGVLCQRFVSHYAGPGKFPGPNLVGRGGGGWQPGHPPSSLSNSLLTL